MKGTEHVKPGAHPVPSSASGDGEFDEIMAYIDDIDRDPDNAEPLSDAEFDSYLSEYSGVPVELSRDAEQETSDEPDEPDEAPEDEPAGSEREREIAPEPEPATESEPETESETEADLEAEADADSEAEADAEADSEAEAEAEPEKEAEPDTEEGPGSEPEAGEEDELPDLTGRPSDIPIQDVRRTIFDQVSQVLDQKKQSRPRRSAVEVAEEYVEQTPQTPRERAKEAEPEGRIIADDLRSFRGLSPAEALSRAKTAVRYYRWRCWMTLLLALLAAYVTAAPTYSLPLPSFVSYVRLPFVYLFILNVLLIAAMFLGVSLLSDGLRMMFRRRFKAEALVFISCIVTLLYSMQIMVSPESGGYLPYHPTVILGLFFAMLARLQRFENVIHACRALARSSGKYAAVNGIPATDGRVHTVWKQEPAGLEIRLMDRMWEEDRVEGFLAYYSPFALAVTCLFAVIAAVAGSGRVSFLWCWSALLSVAIPGGLLTASILPTAIVTGRLSRTGTVLAGPRAADLVSTADSVILQERDLFPAKMIGISGVKVFSGFTPEKVNMCTLALLRESRSNLYNALAASLSRVPVNMPAIEDFTFYRTGGMGAYVNADRVLVGSGSFIVQSGGHLPEGINLRAGIFVSINMQFAGFYPIRYDVQPSIRRAMGYLTRRKITPVLAVRDFNVTPHMVETKFKLLSGTVGFPELEDRIELSKMRDATDDEPIAVLAVDNTANLADAVTSGKRIYSAGTVNLIVGLVAAVLGVALNFFMLLRRSPASITPINMFYYGLLWFVPTLLASFAANRR